MAFPTPQQGGGGVRVGRHVGGNTATALMLAVAYGATTGGMATLIGTPPNELLAGYLNKVYGYEIGCGQWMMIGSPVTLAALPLVGLLGSLVFDLKLGVLPDWAPGK